MLDKAYCLEKLLKILGISREEMVCCGDGYNDISMIQFAGLGAAMLMPRKRSRMWLIMSQSEAMMKTGSKKS